MTSKSSLRSEPIYFDPDGELYLEVGPEKVVYVVCPRSLARASPVSKRMLYGGFAEAKPATGDWRVPLPEDNPEALELLLNIIHGHFAEIPDEIDEIELYEAAVLTNKYDLTHIVRPWAQPWLADLKLQMDIPAHRIWIAWELGDQELFISELDDLRLDCSSNAEGDLVDYTETPLPKYLMLKNLSILGESTTVATLLCLYIYT